MWSGFDLVRGSRRLGSARLWPLWWRPLGVVRLPGLGVLALRRSQPVPKATASEVSNERLPMSAGGLAQGG